MAFAFQAIFLLLRYAFLSPIYMLPLRVYMQFKPEEIAAIIKDFDEPGSLAPTGLHLGGIKYMVIQGESGAVIRGKKVF